MEFEPTRLPEVVLIKPQVFGDARGLLLRNLGASANSPPPASTLQFVQDNHSHSRAAHAARAALSDPAAAGKAGACDDAARCSMSRWTSAAARRPSANGSAWCSQRRTITCCGCRPASRTAISCSATESIFSTSAPISTRPQHERAIRWDDPDIGVQWPLPAGTRPSFPARTRPRPLFEDAEYFP